MSQNDFYCSTAALPDLGFEADHDFDADKLWPWPWRTNHLEWKLNRTYAWSGCYSKNLFHRNFFDWNCDDESNSAIPFCTAD